MNFSKKVMFSISTTILSLAFMAFSSNSFAMLQENSDSAGETPARHITPSQNPLKVDDLTQPEGFLQRSGLRPLR